MCYLALRSYTTWVIMLSFSKCQTLSNRKFQGQVCKFYLQVVRESQRLPQKHILLPLLIVASKNLKVSPNCLKLHICWTQDLEELNWKCLGNLSERLVVVVLVGTSYKEIKKAINSSTQICNYKLQWPLWQDIPEGPSNNANCILGMSNAHLIGLKPLNRREFTLPTVNLDSQLYVCGGLQTLVLPFS